MNQLGRGVAVPFPAGLAPLEERLDFIVRLLLSGPEAATLSEASGR